METDEEINRLSPHRRHASAGVCETGNEKFQSWFSSPKSNKIDRDGECRRTEGAETHKKNQFNTFW